MKKNKWILLGVILCLVLGVLGLFWGKIHTSFMMIEAQTSYNTGHIDKAIVLYQELISEYPDNAELYWRLGIAYYSSGDKLNARKQIQRLKKLKKDKLADDLQQLLESG